MRKIDALLLEYGESHKNAFNKKVHWICVPLIFWSVVGLFWSIPNGLLVQALGDHWFANWALVALAAASVYYFMLSVPLAIGLIGFAGACLFIIFSIAAASSFPMWGIALIVFALAWIGQFYGHKIEGKKPSFLKDLQFLLIGPAWLLHFIYKKVGVKY
jgi:uncharacterized membrane protein YGL010W